MKLMWIFTFVLVFGLCEEGAARNINGKPLHLHMTKREIEQYFGTSDHQEVPEYEVVSPYHSNDDGGFVSYDLRGGGRQRRSLTDLNRPSYKLRAFGKDLHLKLVRNDRLMAPGLQFERKLPSGRISRSPAPENTFYHGHVASDPDSLVAVSNDDGLEGLIRHKEDSMFIQPLPNHLAKHFRTKRDTQPHLIYKTDQFTKRNVDEEGEEKYTSDKPGSPRVRVEREVSNTVGNYKYLEVGVMADCWIEEKYGDKTPKNLLLIMNLVAMMYTDKSIGDIKIIVIVVKLGVIKCEDISMKPSDTAETKMTAMKNYMKQTEDTVVDAYVFVVSQTLGGLALASAICRSPGTETIAGDVGLQTAGTIAHELGHAIALGHDGGECPSGTYIMASVLPSGTKAYQWSSCSSAKLQEFLKSTRSSCLNTPGNSFQLMEMVDKLIGEINSADEQCKYHYGNTSIVCPYMAMRCDSIYCKTGERSCSSKAIPALDGSSCGERSWCIRGECVDNGKSYIDGGWSEWSDFVPCTMTCGGGVTYKERTCTNPPPQHKGKACKGSPKGLYKTCNPEPCPEGQKSYRQQACEEWDPTAVPVYVEKAPCELYCKASDARQAKKRGAVKDGARCTQFSQELDVCVNGECKAVGCDHQFSHAPNDRCGVCNGNGGSCSFESGEFTDDVQKDSTSLIIELPIGTKGACFEENQETSNHICIQDSSGSYVINPESRESSVMQIAGTKVTHETKKTARDKLCIDGPTKASLRIMYARLKEENPGVKYDMYKPNELKKERRGFKGSKYEWSIPDDDVWSNCSAKCAGGTQTRIVPCVRTDDKSPVGDGWCRGKKPIEERECNVQACQPEWHLSRWGDCSKTCGKGVQERSIVCRQKTKDLGFQQVADNLCDAKTKPNTTEFKRHCREIRCLPVWRTEDWSQCSTSCDPGTATRAVLCVQRYADGEDVTVPDMLCKGNKPPTQKKCNLDNGCAPSEKKCKKNNLCQNGAKCMSDPAGYKCKCKKGYKGYFCEAQINPCDDSPCLNGATCVQDDVNFLKYTCQCPTGYSGPACEVRYNPCDTNPCLNSGVCVPDDIDVMEYSCKCVDGYSGKLCKVPPSYELGCFRYSEEIYPVKFGDREKSDEAKKVIEMCRQLAFKAGHKQFAITADSCVALAKDKTVNEKIVATSSCSDGVGEKSALVAYSFEPPPSHEDKGCYNERSGKKAALLDTLGDFKSLPDDVNGQMIVRLCAYMARDWGYKYFAVIKERVCVSGKDAADRYNENGEITEDVSKYCKDGVGIVDDAMEVYRIQ